MQVNSEMLAPGYQCWVYMHHSVLGECLLVFECDFGLLEMYMYIDAATLTQM